VGVVALFVAEHQVHAPQLSSMVLLVPVFVLGVSVGERLRRRVPVRRVDHFVSALLLCSGLVALLT